MLFELVQMLFEVKWWHNQKLSNCHLEQLVRWTECHPRAIQMEMGTIITIGQWETTVLHVAKLAERRNVPGLTLHSWDFGWGASTAGFNDERGTSGSRGGPWSPGPPCLSPPWDQNSAGPPWPKSWIRAWRANVGLGTSCLHHLLCFGEQIILQLCCGRRTLWIIFTSLQILILFWLGSFGQPVQLWPLRETWSSSEDAPTICLYQCQFCSWNIEHHSFSTGQLKMMESSARRDPAKISPTNRCIFSFWECRCIISDIYCLAKSFTSFCHDLSQVGAFCCGKMLVNASVPNLIWNCDCPLRVETGDSPAFVEIPARLLQPCVPSITQETVENLRSRIGRSQQWCLESNLVVTCHWKKPRSSAETLWVRRPTDQSLENMTLWRMEWMEMLISPPPPETMEHAVQTTEVRLPYGTSHNKQKVSPAPGFQWKSRGSLCGRCQSIRVSIPGALTPWYRNLAFSEHGQSENSWITQSPMEITLLSLVYYSAHLISILFNLKDFYLVLLFRKKWEVPVTKISTGFLGLGGPSTHRRAVFSKNSQKETGVELAEFKFNFQIWPS